MNRLTSHHIRRFASVANIFIAVSIFCMPQHAFAFKLYTVGAGSICSFQNIQDAINAASDSDGNSILVAQDVLFKDQHLVITNRNVNLLGGLAHCDSDSYSGQSTIIGTPGHSVVEIEGTSHVYMSGLELTGAVMDTDHSGGGIYFGGNGSLEMTNTWVHNNQAGYGGGIDMSPSGPSTLTMQAGTTVSGNTALVSGGGVRIEGQTVFNVSSGFGEATVYIAENGALGQGNIGYGGGVEVLGPAVANIGSASVDVNTAPYGGGIAVLGTSNGPAHLNLYTSDLATPISVHDNVASGTGGGIFLKPNSDNGFNFAQLCAQDFVLSGNTAANGTALYLDEDGGQAIAMAFLNSPACNPPPNAVACAAGTECNQINDNHGSAGGEGSTLLIQSGGLIYANRFAARLNSGADVVHFVSDVDNDSGGDYVQFHNCLLANNTVSGSLILGIGTRIGAGTQILVDTCTLAGNSYTNIFLPVGPTVIDADTNFLEITNSIIYDSVSLPLLFQGPATDLTMRYDIVSNLFEVPTGSVGIGTTAPTFVDAPSGNFHLARSSAGIDFAPALGGLDLDGNPRSVDLTDIPNNFGFMDLGAYENQQTQADKIFHNGFE
jgi:hypothetical protein